MMRKNVWLIILPFFLNMCIEFSPSPLVVGETVRTNAQNELTIPLNVTKAFTPTGYFYNVWAPADSSFTKVDPEKWNNFLAYQSIYQHPACRDRVPLDTLIKYDSTLPAYIHPQKFYHEFVCNQFTYAPISEDDLYGGVFWLRNDNFGNYPGVKVNGGAKKVKFWARSISPTQYIKFGVGVSNRSTLKPWYYFSSYVDTWGNSAPLKTEHFQKKPILNPATGIMVDSLVSDSVLEGDGFNTDVNITNQWTLYTINLGVLYAFNTHADTTFIRPDSMVITQVRNDSMPDHRMIGSFFWAMEANFINDSLNVTNPIILPNGTKSKVKYGSATVLIDGIRYE
jgi:hypothetical protein